MTDNDIIKALERCSTIDTGIACQDCPLTDECNKNSDILVKSALDLINRQRAEIEEYHALQVMAIEELVDRLQKAIFGD